MAAVFSLRRILDEVDGFGGTTVYLDRDSGEILALSEDEVGLAEGDEADDPESLADWQREALPEQRRFLASPGCVALPGLEDFDEYREMQRFARTVEDEGVAVRLLHAIQGRGAFARFKHAVQEHGLADAWYAHRERALADLLAYWLEGEGIPFHRDV